MSDAAPKVPDPRRNAWRDDLAAESLRAVVAAPRYAKGETRRVLRAAVALRKSPDAKRGFETEVLFGEAVSVFDTADGWAWVQADRDGYVGYLPADALGAPAGSPTHRVRATATFLYPEPDLKSPPVLALSLNTPLIVLETRDRFTAIATGGFVMAHHIADAPARDFVEIAERFEGTPYLWGGRTRTGLDCSGLVQLGMDAAGLACPRDSDMQCAEVGTAVAVPGPLADPVAADADVEGLRRGDLVFWPGHVGIMTDALMLLHANAHHMSTVVEPVIDAAVRIRRLNGSVVSAVRRPERLGAGTSQAAG